MAIPNHVQDYLPLIVPRVEFQPRMSPLPSITARKEFTPDVIAYIEMERQAIEGREEERESLLDANGGRAGGATSQQPARGSTPNTATSTVTAPPRIIRLRPTSKIPKPEGQPGRRVGGYNTEEELLTKYHWNKAEVNRLKTDVRAAAKKHLNMTVSWRGQSRDMVAKVCDEMMDEDHFPILVNYEGCWPVTSILKLILKYNAEASKKTTARTLNTRLMAAMRGETPADEESD